MELFTTLKVIGVAIFALTVFGFFRNVNTRLNELSQNSPNFKSRGWLFFTYSDWHFAYNPLELKLVIITHEVRSLEGPDVNINIHVSRYLRKQVGYKQTNHEIFISQYNKFNEN